MPKNGYARLLITIALAAGCAAMSVAVRAQELVADFTGAQPSGRYSFASSTPKTLGELLKGNPQQNSVNIVGHLFLPSGTEKVPAVLLMHGSGGIYSAMLGYWPERFNAAGFAVLSVVGASIEGNRSLREKAAESAVVFLRKVFTP